MNDDAPDSSDLDAIEELKLSRGYQLVTNRIRAEIERRRDELEEDGDPEQNRGYIRALRVVLQLPDILLSELSVQVK